MYVYLYTVHITDCFMAVYILGEVERQLVKAPLAAAISPYLISTTHPTPCMKCEMKQEMEIDHNTRSPPTLLDKFKSKLAKNINDVSARYFLNGSLRLSS